MLRADREALPVLTTLAVAITEAIIRGEITDLPLQVQDVLQEWLEMPHGRSHFAVVEMSQAMKAATQPQS